MEKKSIWKSVLIVLGVGALIGGGVYIYQKNRKQKQAKKTSTEETKETGENKVTKETKENRDIKIVRPKS